MNNSIQFWRYLFTCVICMLHFEVEYFAGEQPVFRCGYLVVEFFFILSGFFLMKHAENSRDSSLTYTLQKVKRFYPDLLISWGLLIFNLSWLFKYDLKTVIGEIFSHIWEYLLLNSTGITWNILNGVTWYLSALLIARSMLIPIWLIFLMFCISVLFRKWEMVILHICYLGMLLGTIIFEPLSQPMYYIPQYLFGYVFFIYDILCHCIIKKRQDATNI